MASDASNSMTVTVTFTVDHAASPEHAEEVVRRYLEGKGVTARGTVELTPVWSEEPDMNGERIGRFVPRYEPRYGYDTISSDKTNDHD